MHSQVSSDIKIRLSTYKTTRTKSNVTIHEIRKVYYRLELKRIFSLFSTGVKIFERYIAVIIRLLKHILSIFYIAETGLILFYIPKSIQS